MSRHKTCVYFDMQIVVENWRGSTCTKSVWPFSTEYHCIRTFNESFNYLDVSEASNKGENEWYYYCKRGRKYKNSVRPNRVTAGSGFWKATGIDKSIYSKGEVIGLKKSLVYYRGSAGKGTKTEWMMHEFRLPNLHSANTIAQEAVRNFKIHTTRFVSFYVS